MDGELQTVDFLWAKTGDNGRPGISVRDHCVNVGRVAEQLRNLMPPAIQEICSSKLILLIAAHDIGKISVGFLVKCPAWVEEQGLRNRALNFGWLKSESNHAAISQNDILSRLTPARVRRWSIAVGGHHGRFLGKGKVGRPELEKDWAVSARDRLFGELIEIFGPPPDEGPLSDAHLLVVAGWMTVSDWIGSNEFYFPLGLDYRREDAEALASRAVRGIRWGAGRVSSELSFCDLFKNREGKGFEPNELQRTVLNQVHGRGLHVIEAPMGGGKTEAALAAAYQLIKGGFNHGIYFALPTQLTSNRVHERMAAFLFNALDEETDHPLAHANSWLQRELKIHLRPAVGGVVGDDSIEQVREARSWFASSKQALLARYGVGTIDQALLAVLAAKFCAVRLFGLAGKVVILDEVHSYDAYMSVLIDQLIRRLLEVNCSVIVLSATLTTARRESLLMAGGCAEPSPVDAYPLVSSIHGDGMTVESAPASETSTTVPVRVCYRVDDEDQILEEACTAASAGACVLIIRNTVDLAQETFQLLKSIRCEDGPEVGLLHSRFPQFEREEREGGWVAALGKDSATRPRGCLLVSTQVVEQSVDIDADLLLSDLAPTDMLLQRMGRLWRHPRGCRLVSSPEIWILAPKLSPSGEKRTLCRELGVSGRVYPPYVLLRSNEVWKGRQRVSLPTDIRSLLDATYRECPADSEPVGWQELRQELEARVAKMENIGSTRTQIFENVDVRDEEGMETRWNDFPTANLVLLRSQPVEIRPGEWVLEGANGDRVESSCFEWRFAVAAAIHRNLVRLPLFALKPALEGEAAPEWLTLHARGATVYGVIDPDSGRLEIPGGTGAIGLSYLTELGVRIERLASTAITNEQWEDDDESWF